MWGQFGVEQPCAHLLALRQFLTDSNMYVYGEFTEAPDGWVNVHCGECRRTYEVTLRPPWKTAE